MRVLVTSRAPGLDAEIEPFFWHSTHMNVVDTETLACEAIETPAMPNVHAAGTRLGLLATHQNVGAAISNDYGPNCYIVLDSVGIPMFLAGGCRTVREAVGDFRAGRLVSVHGPTSAGPAASEAAR